jgi:hypothetical protein
MALGPSGPYNDTQGVRASRGVGALQCYAGCLGLSGPHSRVTGKTRQTAIPDSLLNVCLDASIAI